MHLSDAGIGIKHFCYLWFLYEIMNAFKRVSGHIYYFYGMIVFLITLVLVAIPAGISLLFPEPKRARIVHPSYWVWMHVFLPLVFCRVKRTGKENFKKGENYVVVTNHNSFVDILVSVPWIPGPNKTLAKIEMARIPIFGVVYRAGSILLDRKQENSRRESFTKMQETLKMGLHLSLYPEGTRNKTDKPLQPFFDGAFITAIRSQKPIIPSVILGTKDILPPAPKFWAQPKKIKIHFFKPVPTKGLAMKDRQELSGQIHELMEQYILEHTQD